MRESYACYWNKKLGNYFTAEFYKEEQNNIPAFVTIRNLQKKAKFFALIKRLADNDYGNFLPELMYRKEQKAKLRAEDEKQRAKIEKNPK